MCGICGLVNNDNSRPVDRRILAKMNQVIRHRGPDSDGFYVKANVGMGIRRLAIIDLVSGNQPISNEDGTIWVVFNGEIYNHGELRRNLAASGHRLQSNTDTEVLVHLYEDRGPACVDQLRGMFAFAIWDENERQLLLARDRVGKKPLYYGEQDGAFLFGSELKCILQYPGFPREPDWEAIHHYLTLQYVPDPWTALKGIRKLPPGHRLVWRDGEIRVEPYWDLEFEPKWRVPGPELRDQLKQAITDAVHMRLISDVPLGAHLSGGIDSSIIVGLMAQMTDQPVKTFSIGFEEDAFSELPFARAVAHKLATDHHEFILKPDALEILPKLVWHFDEPFADPAAIPTWYLSKLTREHVTVALNGDGGDETFAGYQRYYADIIADTYRLVPGFIRHGLTDRALRLLPVRTDRPMERSYVMALRQLTRASDFSHDASVVRWGAYFSEEEKRGLYNDHIRQIVNNSASVDLLSETFKRAKAVKRLDRTLYTDVKNYLPGALLPKVDRTTMAHSLEARSPFLDHKVMELAARLPVRWKVNGWRTKWILKDLFRDLIPVEVLNRGKLGFSVPLGQWCRGPLYHEVRQRLLARDSRIGDHFHWEPVARLLQENRQGLADHGKRLWTLLNLEMWLRSLGEEAHGD